MDRNMFENSMLRCYCIIFYYLHESIKKIPAVVRSSGCLGMVLNAADRQLSVLHSLKCLIIKVDVRSIP